MELELFSRRMVELIPQMIRGCFRQEHNSLTRGEITLPQLSVMECLARRQSLPMHEIAQQLDITRPAATGLINRLINQQLVAREHDMHDRRIVRVSITAKGRKMLSNIWNQKRRTLERVFAQITPAERAQYLKTLERVVDILMQQPSSKAKSRGALTKR